MTLHHVTSLAGDQNLGFVSKVLESLVTLLSTLEGLHVVNFFLAVVRDQVELLVSGRHLLHKVVPDRVASSDLGQQLSGIRVEVLDDRLLAGLVVNNGGSGISLESHCHGHRCSLGLLGVLGVESFILDSLLVQVGVVEDYNTHTILEVLGVCEINEEAFLTKLVLWLLSIFVKLGLESQVIL